MAYLPVLCLIVFVNSVHSARILAIFPSPSYSHQVVYQPVWKELSLRGHQVTVITTNPLKDKSLVNLTEIDLHDISYDIATKKYKIGLLGATKHSKQENINVLVDMYTDITSAQLESPEVQALIQDPNMEFDLVLAEYLWQTSYAFKEVFNCPLVGILSFPLSLSGHDNFGNPSHPITHPDLFLPFSQNLSFFERVKSVIYSFAFRLFSLKLKTIYTEQLKRYFPNVTKDIRDIAREASLTFVNTNPVLSVPRPNVPAIIEVTGLHIREIQPLPTNVQNFLDESTQGVIYFSFGSNVKSSHLPEETLNMILNAFRELPYNVLWKFEAENLPNKPNNVYISKWLPQQDVLRHRNVKAFITQAGLQSLDESIYFKVPVIAIPFFGDQPNNARRIAEIGVGLNLDFLTLTKEQLQTSIREVVDNKIYKQKVTRLSNIVKDQQVDALDKVIWWIEYVLRHDGAYHLRSPATDLPLYQYFLLDVIGFLLVLAITVIYIFVKLTKILLSTKFLV